MITKKEKEEERGKELETTTREPFFPPAGGHTGIPFDVIPVCHTGAPAPPPPALEQTTNNNTGRSASSQPCDVNTKMNQSATSTAKCRPVKRHFLGKNIQVSYRSQRQSFSYTYHVPAFRFGCWSEQRHRRHGSKGNVVGGSFYLKPRRNFAGISTCDWRWRLNQSCACCAAVRTAWSASARPTHASSTLLRVRVSPRLHPQRNRCRRQ